MWWDYIGRISSSLLTHSKAAILKLLIFGHEHSALGSRTEPCQKSREALGQLLRCSDLADVNPFQQPNHFCRGDDALPGSSGL